MKKVMGIMLAAALAVCSFMGVSQFKAEQRSITIGNDRIRTVKAAEGFQVNAPAAVLMDAGSGQVLLGQNMDEELPPASVTKIMTMLLILEGVEQKRISFDDVVTVSENAASMGGSQMYLEPGEKHTVEELLMGVAMVSANDGCVALAEHLCGTVEIFVEKMNSRAKELGMNHSCFMNTNGLPAEGHYSSAYDIAVMTAELLRHENSHKWLTKKQAVVEIGLPGKEKDFELINSNKLLYQYEGALGVKTGFTQDAMFCLSGAAERNGMRLVAVVLGAESSAVRFEETKKLLDYGFSNYENVIIAEKGEVLKTCRVEKGDASVVRAVAADDYGIIAEKGTGESFKTRVRMKGEIRLPVKKGDEIGSLVVYQKGSEAAEFPLVAEKTVGPASAGDFFRKLITETVDGR